MEDTVARIKWREHILSWTDSNASSFSFPPHFALIHCSPEGISLCAMAIPKGMSWQGRITVRPTRDSSPLELVGKGDTPQDALDACFTRALSLILAAWGPGNLKTHVLRTIPNE